MNDESTPRSNARQRALRAARVATLGLVLAAPGCYSAHESSPPVEPDPTVARPVSDAGVVDDAALADAGVCVLGDAGWEAYQACCDENGWDWERGCAAWGPFVPPSDGEIA